MRTSTGESGGFGAAFAAGAGAPPGGMAAGGRQEASEAAHAVAVARATSARSGWRESRAGCMAGWGWGGEWEKCSQLVKWGLTSFLNGVRLHEFIFLIDTACVRSNVWALYEPVKRHGDAAGARRTSPPEAFHVPARFRPVSSCPETRGTAAAPVRTAAAECVHRLRAERGRGVHRRRGRAARRSAGL